MRYHPLNQKAFMALAGFFILICANFALLYLDSGYKIWIYVAINCCFFLAIIYAYRKWFSTSLKELTVVSRNVLGTKAGSTNNELGLAIEAIHQLTEEKKKAIDFVNAIGKGALEADQSTYDFIASEGDGSLAAALQKMHAHLKEIAVKEKERAWVTDKLASFSEVFRSSTDSLPELCSTIVSKLVKYLGANQASIFILNNEQENNRFLEMAACYAFDRKKHLTKRVELGEGLLGQTFLEKETLYITDIPQGYTRITSGLGDGTPSCLLIIPVKQNDEVLGMLEIASFKTFQPYHIEFVEKMSEGVAATIATTKIRERTSKLLHESQTQTQELKAQEEEMRQNMEELQATQEASHRMQEELRGIEQSQREKIAELSQARQIMQEQEEKLKQSQEKAQARSLKFKEKMEQLDIALEGKNAEVKILTKQLQGIKEQFNLTEEDILKLK